MNAFRTVESFVEGGGLTTAGRQKKKTKKKEKFVRDGGGDGSATIKLQQIKYGGNTSSGKMAEQNRKQNYTTTTIGRKGWGWGGVGRDGGR